MGKRYQNIHTMFIADNSLYFIFRNEDVSVSNDIEVSIGSSLFKLQYVERDRNFLFYKLDMPIIRNVRGKLKINNEKVNFQELQFRNLGNISWDKKCFNVKVAANGAVRFKRIKEKKNKNKIIVFNIDQSEEKTAFFIPTAFKDELKDFKLTFKKRREQVNFQIEVDGSCVGPITYKTQELVDESATSVRGDFFYYNEKSKESVRLFWGGGLEKQMGNRYAEPNQLGNGQQISVYQTKNHQVSFIVASEEKIISESSDTYIELDKVSLNKTGKLSLSVNITGHYNKNEVELCLRLRNQTEEAKVEKTFSVKRIKNNRYDFEVDVLDYKWESLYWDFLIKLKTPEGHSLKLKISNDSIRNKIMLQYFTFKNEITTAEDFLLFPYISADEKLSLAYREKGKYESARERNNERIAFVLAFIFGWYHKRKNIWLIHEKFSKSAQDNSFYFFRHCYEDLKKRNVYFVLDKDSRDRNQVEGMEERVLDFMSIKHLYFLIVSKLIISSEAKGHGYAWRVSKGLIRPIVNQKEFVFLQHGVIGFKRVDGAFKANGMNHANLFVTSAEWEKKIVMEELGYSDTEVIVTGLARWDDIHLNPPKKKRQMLYMPTWRNWLEEVSDEEFMNSNYYKSIVSVMKSEEIKQALEIKKLKMIFYVHPKFNQFIDLLVDKEGTIEVSNLSDEPLNKLLGESVALMTDYSSLAWEALYQNIPVLFYQFDLDDYVKNQGSYIDFSEIKFGKRIEKESAISEQILNFDENRNIVDGSTYFNMIDTKNNQRIFAEIKKYECSNKYKEKLLYKLKRDPLVRTSWRKVKKIMRAKDRKRKNS